MTTQISVCLEVGSGGVGAFVPVCPGCWVFGRTTDSRSNSLYGASIRSLCCNAALCVWGAGQWTEGNAGVDPTQILINEGKFKMQGMASAGGAVTYGRADGWGYFGIPYVTATQSRTIRAYSMVAYDGIIRQYAILWWSGWASAHIWIYETIRVYDTSNWQIVASNTVTVYDDGVQSGWPWQRIEKSKRFYPDRDMWEVSVSFPATAGRQYAIEVFVECQCAANGAGLAQSQSAYNFLGPTQQDPSIQGFVYVKWIEWYYA